MINNNIQKNSNRSISKQKNGHEKKKKKNGVLDKSQLKPANILIDDEYGKNTDWRYSQYNRHFCQPRKYEEVYPENVIEVPAKYTLAEAQ